MPPSSCYVGFYVAQQDGDYGKQMDASIEIQGHGAELLQQVALLFLQGQLAIKHGRTSVFPVLCVCACVCV